MTLDDFHYLIGQTKIRFMSPLLLHTKGKGVIRRPFFMPQRRSRTDIHAMSTVMPIHARHYMRATGTRQRQNGGAICVR